MALIPSFHPFHLNEIPVADQLPDYNPEPDAEGFIPWITITNVNNLEKRLAAICALLAVAKLSFKLKYGEYGTTACLHVLKPDAKAIEVLWNLTNLVNVEAPPVLKININKMLATDEAQQCFEHVPEIEGSRFDDI